MSRIEPRPGAVIRAMGRWAAAILVCLAWMPAAAQTLVKIYKPVDFIYGDGANGNNWKSLEDYQAWWNGRAQTSFDECMARPKTYGYGWSCGWRKIAGFDPYQGAPYGIYYNGKAYWNYTRPWSYEISVAREGIDPPVTTESVCSVYDGSPSCAAWAAFANIVCPKPTGATVRLLSTGANGDRYNEVTCDSTVEASACPSCIVGSPDQHAMPPLVGNPINPSIPEKVQQDTDYEAEGGRLTVNRSFRGSKRKWASMFSSLLDFTPQRSSGQAPPIETFWLSANGVTFNELRFEEIATSTNSEVHVTRANGIKLIASEGAGGSFNTPDASSPITRVALPGGDFEWHLRSRENRLEVFRGSDGRRLKLVFPDGQFVAFDYPDANTVEATSSRSGRKVVVSMHSSGAMQSALLPDGSRVDYVVENGRYRTVRYPDGNEKTYLYDEIAFTGGALLRDQGNLTGIRDELGVRIGSYYYGTEGTGGQILSTEGAAGVGKHSLFLGGTYSRITDPLGAQTLYYWTVTGDGYKRLQSINQPAGSGSAATSSSFSFAANGRLTSVNDFAGRRICYASDPSRNLETVRVEGLSAGATCSTYTAASATLPVGARKVSTAWHPDWRMEARVAEPGRIITKVYNGQADPFNGGAVASCAPSTALLPDGKPIAVLCKQVEQATTDANGSQGFSASLQVGVASRTRSWAYNQYGQVLTETDPLNNTTSYAYYSDTTADHTRGDLQSTTNAKNQVTSYGNYNKHGQLLESVDPNGVVTTNTYDLRQRLLSTSVGGQTTSYEYDAAGQLLKVTSPDTSWLGYEYDAAHRQVAVKDSLGNRTEYVLDNAGNKTGQSVKDPLGNLARSLARSIDALGRVQQTTGRD